MAADVREDAQREEAVNVRLADLLNESGASARAETIVRSGRRKKFPDVRVEWGGLRVVIEASSCGSGYRCYRRSLGYYSFVPFSRL